LGRSVAARACDGDDAGGGELQTAVVRCEFVQRGEGVFHLEKREGTRRVRRTGRIRDYRRGSSPLRSDIDEIVTVKMRALQRDETIAALNSPRVGADVTDLKIRVALNEPRAAELGQFFYAHGFHRFPRFVKYS